MGVLASGLCFPFFSSMQFPYYLGSVSMFDAMLPQAQPLLYLYLEHRTQVHVQHHHA